MQLKYCAKCAIYGMLLFCHLILLDRVETCVSPRPYMVHFKIDMFMVLWKVLFRTVCLEDDDRDSDKRG